MIKHICENVPNGIWGTLAQAPWLQEVAAALTFLVLDSSFLGGAVVKNPPAKCRRRERRGSSPGVGKTPWRRKWQPTPVFLPGKSHGQRSLVGYSPGGHKELDAAEHWISKAVSVFCWLSMWGVYAPCCGLGAQLLLSQELQSCRDPLCWAFSLCEFLACLSSVPTSGGTCHLRREGGRERERGTPSSPSRLSQASPESRPSWTHTHPVWHLPCSPLTLLVLISLPAVTFSPPDPLLKTPSFDIPWCSARWVFRSPLCLLIFSLLGPFFPSLQTSEERPSLLYHLWGSVCWKLRFL